MVEVPRAATPHWLIAAVRTRPEAQAAAITLVFVLARGLAAGFGGLGIDESYTLSISRELHLSYFDHPPLHQWIVNAAGHLFGWGRAVRIPFVVMSGVTSWLMFLLTRRLFGAAAGVWATAALSLAGFFSFAAGVWILPDGSLDLCLIGAALALSGVLLAEPGSKPSHPWRQWLAAGVWLGLAGLSKYQAALFCVGLLAFLASTPGQRRWLRHPAPYAAALVTLAMLSPVLIWNTEHGWVSLLFQGGRGAAKHGVRPLEVLTALAGQAVLLTPWVFAVAAAALWRGARQGRASSASWFCVMLAAPAIVLFSLSPLWGDRGLPHWSMPGWLFVMPLMGELLARAMGARAEVNRRPWPRVWAVGSAAGMGALWLLFVADCATGFVAKAFPGVRTDPTVTFVEWKGLRAQVQARLRTSNHCLFAAAISWTEAGKIGRVVGDLVPVRVLTADQRGFAFLREHAPTVGCDALIIATPSKVRDNLAGLQPYFTSIRPYAIDWEGRGAREVQVVLLDARQMLKPYPPAYSGQ